MELKKIIELKDIDELLLDGDNIARWNSSDATRKFYLENVLTLCLHCLKKGIEFYCMFDPGGKKAITTNYDLKYLDIFKYTDYFSYPSGQHKADDQLILFMKNQVENLNRKAFIITNDLYRKELNYSKKHLNRFDSENYKIIGGAVRFKHGNPYTIVINDIGLALPIGDLEETYEELISILKKKNAENSSKNKREGPGQELIKNANTLVITNYNSFSEKLERKGVKNYLCYNKDQFTSITKSMKN